MPAQRFLSYLKYEKRYSAHTLKAYETDLAQFFEYIRTEYGEVPLAEITHFFIRSWIVSLIDKGVSPRSVNRKITSLKSFFRFQIKESRLAQNPMAKIQSPKVGKRLPVFIDENRMGNLFEEIEFSDDFMGKRDRTMLEMFYGTGMRLSELIGLKVNDFNLSQQTVKVLGKRNKERIIPVGITLCESLKSYLADRKIYLVSKSSDCENLFVDNRAKTLYPKFVYRTIRKYLGMVTTGEKRNPHVLRHTFATHMLNNGAEINAVKELLGHASLAATQVYTHNTIEKLKNIYKQAHPKA
jgi:integrase/recombinase XerC